MSKVVNEEHYVKTKLTMYEICKVILKFYMLIYLNRQLIFTKVIDHHFCDFERFLICVLLDC